jgi:hypothetical protein
MSNEKSKVVENTTTAIEKATTDIEAILARCNVTALATMPALTQAVVLATGIQQLRKALTDDIVAQVFIPLQGTQLGFVTDKDTSGGYPIAVVRDVMIDAMIHGLRPVGNEINVIAGRMYAAKNGVARLVQQFPGVTDVRITPGVPALVGDKGALVPIRLDLKVHGQPLSVVRELTKAADGTMHDTRLPIRVNSGMGSDAVIGKATRKILKAALDVLTGCTLQLNDGDTLDTVGEVTAGPSPEPTPPEQDGQRMKLGGNGKNAKTVAVPHDPETGELTEETRSTGREPGQEG